MGSAQVSSCREHITFRPCVVVNLLPPVPGPTPRGPKGSLCLLRAGQGLERQSEGGTPTSSYLSVAPHRVVPREACACWGQGRVLGGTEKAGPHSQQARAWVHLPGPGCQGIKVKHDPKPGGSLITLCLPNLGRSSFLNGVRVGVDQRVGSEGWSTHPLGGAACRDQYRTLLLLLAL